MVILETSIQGQSCTSCWEGVGLTPGAPIPIPLPATRLRADGSCRRESHVSRSPRAGAGPRGEEPAASEDMDAVSALVVEQRGKRLMVGVQGMAVFSALLWPTISRVQSRPPAAPVAPCASAAVAGSQRVPEKRGGSPGPAFSWGWKLLPLPETSLKHKTDGSQWQRVQGNE